MESLTFKKGGISADILKLVAIIAMLIDHIAWAFVPLNSFLGFFMHIFGRITLPIMSFFIAEGFYHTRDVEKYIARLSIFAIISQIPFTYFKTGKFIYFRSFFDLSMCLNVIFTLLFGLVALYAMKSSLSESKKQFILVCLLVLSFLSDWIFFGVFYILIFGMNRGNFKRQAFMFSLNSFFMVLSSMLLMAQTRDWYFSLFQLGVFLALPLIYFYNGKRDRRPIYKWTFYVFYPVHLVVLYIIDLLGNK